MEGWVLLLDGRHNNQAEIADLIRLLWLSCERRNARRTCCWVLTRNLNCKHTLICCLPLSRSSPFLSKLTCKTNLGCNSTDVAACLGICNNWMPGKRDFRESAEIINELEEREGERRGKERERESGSIWQPQHNHNMETCREHTERTKLLIILTICTLSNSQLISSSNFSTEGTLLST